MPADFDTLTRLVAQSAERLKAFGYLNTIRSESSGMADGFEVRFQPNPIHSLWRERRLGWSQRFAGAADVETFLTVVNRTADECEKGIDANDADALSSVLKRAEEYRLHA